MSPQISAIQAKTRPIFRAYGVKRATLFGSHAKGTATTASDVDLLIDSQLTGLKFVGLMENLKQALDEKPIDVINITHIEQNSPIAREIAKTGVVIYEK